MSIMVHLVILFYAFEFISMGTSALECSCSDLFSCNFNPGFNASNELCSGAMFSCTVYNSYYEDNNNSLLNRSQCTSLVLGERFFVTLDEQNNIGRVGPIHHLNTGVGVFYYIPKKY
eukprot:Pgem_evm2s8316